MIEFLKYSYFPTETHAIFAGTDSTVRPKTFKPRDINLFDAKETLEVNESMKEEENLNAEEELDCFNGKEIFESHYLLIFADPKKREK